MYEYLYRTIKSHSDAYLAASPIINNRDGVFSTFQIGNTIYREGDFMSMEEYMRLFLNFQIDSSAWNKLYKREFIKHGFLKGRTNEDYLFLYYNCKEWYGSKVGFVMCETPHYYYSRRANSICHQDKNHMDTLLVAVTKNCIEIIDDLNSWNTSLLPIVYRRIEYASLKANGQMILLPKSEEKYPEECDFIDKVIRQRLSLFRRGMSLMNREKLINFR